MIVCEGCRSDSLLGYLKALGLLRLLSTQHDSQVRGSWDGAVFRLETTLSREQVEAFFIESYVPSVVLNPWNNGAGFDGKGDTASKTLQRIAQTQGTRWLAYRDALTFIREAYIETGARERLLTGGDKAAFLRDLRMRCPESMLPWLDAAVLLTAERPRFPSLLGSGGNDGRLDFSINFAARALDVCGEDPLRQAAMLLRDALHDTTMGSLQRDVAIGQFSPRHAGGANSTNGYDDASLVNPWDYVLMIEGSLLFSGAVAARTGKQRGASVFPFAFSAVASGYGSASREEQKSARGELWLPVWDGWASLSSVREMLRQGRMDLPVEGSRATIRSAATAQEAAVAIVTLGAPLGLRRVERMGFVQRNGLAFAATSLGSLDVRAEYDEGVAILSRHLAGWVERAQKVPGSAVREAARRFNDQLMDFSRIVNEPARLARARQELLAAVADLDRAVSHDKDFKAAPMIGADAARFLDDGSAVHRLALAVASYGAGSSERGMREMLRTTGDDPVGILREAAERRLRLDAAEPRHGWLKASRAVSIEDVSEFLALDRSSRVRFARLLRAYGLIRLSAPSNAASPSDSADHGTPEAIPAAYALLKLVFDNPAARDERIVRMLFTGHPKQALAHAVRRARVIGGLPGGNAPRDVSRVGLEDAQWYGAALMVPVRRAPDDYRPLLNAALTRRVLYHEAQAYLETLEPFGKDQTSRE